MVGVTTGLNLLADWFDAKNPDDEHPEVQSDLRKWAAEVAQSQARVEKLENALRIVDMHKHGCPGCVRMIADALAEGP